MMRHQVTVILPFILPVLISSCILKDQDYDVFAESYDTLSWSVGNAERLEVTLVNGNILVSGHDEPVIDAVIYRRAWGLNFEDAEIHLDDIDINQEIRDKTFLLQAEIPDINRKYISSFGLTSPEKMELDFFGITGDFKVEDIAGDARMRLSSGSLECSHMEGDLDLKINDGGIGIYAHSGNVSAEITDGSIYCQFALLPIDGEADFETGEGSVFVELPPDASFSFQVSTTLGKINIQGFDSISYDTNQLYFRTGTVNGGGASLNISCGSGGITIESPQDD